MFGAALVIAGAVDRWGDLRVSQLAIWAILIALGMRTFCQSAYWMSNRALTERAIAINPRSFAAYAMLAVEEGDRNPKQGIADAGQSLSIEPGYYGVAEVLEVLLARERRYDEALDVIDRTRRYSDTRPATDRADRTLTLREVARIAESNNDFAAAAECYRRILAERPADADAQEGLARSAANGHAPATQKS
jgi:tetratricopeptide (TPR) repeat protein